MWLLPGIVKPEMEITTLVGHMQIYGHPQHTTHPQRGDVIGGISQPAFIVTIAQNLTDSPSVV